MLRVPCLVLLVVVAISWSQVDSKPRPDSESNSEALLMAGTKLISTFLSFYNTSSNDPADYTIDNESVQKGVRTFVVALYLLSVESPTQKDILSVKYQEAVDKKWNSPEEFAQYINKLYKDVTGINLEESSNSFLPNK